MIISVTYNPSNNSFYFVKGIKLYKPFTSFFNVEDDFFTSTFLDEFKNLIYSSIIEGNVLNIDEIKTIVPVQIKDKQFKIQL